MKIQTIQDARDFLFTRRATGMKLGLEHMHDLVRLMGHPEYRLPAVHIAGTNGKGSTSAILESILRKAGLKTGLYTSPHLIDERERLRICGTRITEAEILTHLKAMMPHIEKAGASFFEILTAMAFKHFTENDVDMAVLETGLGGRLDATSVITPKLCIITSIDKDHTKTLGNCLTDIAGEKAGILKTGVTGIIGTVQEEVHHFFRNFGEKNNIPLLFTEDHIKIKNLHVSENGSVFDCQTRDAVYSDCNLRLLGRHQVLNAGAALMAVDCLREQGHAISDKAVHGGLATVRWPARLEKICDAPKIIIDSAHNPVGAASLAAAIKELIKYDRLILLFGVLADKKYESMLKQLAPLTDEFVFTQPLSDRALHPERLAALPCVRGKTVHCNTDIGEAWKKARSLANEGDCIIAAGSIYLVGELLLLESNTQPGLIQ
ncbi:bifunctional folylpolyglutamate synthase/dihydrofolate synthase [bacterium]|nr:bifunctional folylpolyglutamate synthase/dihydrofolate synthase [bacterium]